MRCVAMLAAAFALLALPGCGAADGTVGGRCVYADAGTAGTCDPGLRCLQLLGCDPPDTNGPDCGLRCVDCSQPADSVQTYSCQNQP